MAGPDVKGRRGPFITFEGGDGAGKSTQIALLGARLKAAGCDVLATREPGGSPGAEAIRSLLVSGAVDRWSPLAEALLMFAARADHLEKTINPARARGAVVLCDRFADSTTAYQGVAGGLGVDAIDALRELVVGSDGPDLTIVLDIAEETGLARSSGRGGDSRFEEKGSAYQRKVRRAFLDIAAREARRFVVVDASAPAEIIAAEIALAVKKRFGIG